MSTKTMSEPGGASDDALGRWRDRERYWARKLGRLRLGVEPLDQQLARYRRVTWALTIVPAAISLLFVSLFTVFGHPGIGLILVAVLLAPVVAVAWLDYGLLALKARRYEAERAHYLAASAR